MTFNLTPAGKIRWPLIAAKKKRNRKTTDPNYRTGMRGKVRPRRARKGGS